jgi:ABC-2 type transport system permease protein
MEQYIFPPEPGEERGFSAKSETAIVWQRYNPYPELQFTDMLDGEWLFAADAADSSEHFHAFNPEDETTSGMYELLFPFPGAFRQLAGASGDLIFKPLVKSSEDSGYTKYSDVADQRRAGDSRRTLKNPTHAEQVLAARIQSADFAQSSDVSSDPKINVIVVSDIDMLHRAFFNIRANPNNELIKFQFQNVPFALNVIDSLAGEPRFIEVRKRREMHGRLTTVEAEVQRTVYNDLSRQIAEAQKKLDDNTAAAIAERKKLVDKANERLQKEKDAGQLGYAQFMAIQNETSLQIDAAEQREALKKVSLQQEFDRNLKQIRSQRKRKTLALENYYKYVAVVAPPLPPLMVGLFVFLYRRSREKEGVAAARLR